jgi:ribosome-binding factor A
MPAAGYRQERLAEQMRVEVAELLAGKLKDPRVGFTTVTRVELSGDLHHARVAISVFGSPQAQEETLAGLSSAAGYLRREIGRRLRLRRTPELVFVLDHGTEDGLKIEALLQKLKSGAE